MPGWTRVDNDLIERSGELGHATFAVYAAIAMHADGAGVCWPSVSRIAAVTRCSRRTVLYAIEKLELAGVLKVVRTRTGQSGRGVNRYTLTPHEPSEATKPPSATREPPSATTKPDLVSPLHLPGFARELEQEHRTRPIEQDPKNKKQRSALQPPQGLLALIDGWNGLPEHIVSQKARRDPPAKEVLAGWNRLLKDPDSRELLADVPAILEAIRSAEFCHGQGWFSLAWLFGRNGSGELKLQKLLNGGYRQKERSNGRTQRTLPVGPGQRYDPTAGPAKF